MANNQPLTHSILAGAIAGTSVDTILFPLDTIKTRLQSSEGFFKAGGLKGIYSGLGSIVAGSAPSGALFFFTYDFLKRELLSSFSPSYYPICHMIAASGGEIVACLVRVPTEVVKQRVQTGQYPSTRIAFKSIAAKGIGEFYTGYLSTVFREIPFTCIQFPLYEFFKLKWAQRNKRENSPWESALCGSAAGGIAAGLTTPFDVVKTRLMLKKSKTGVDYSGFFNTMKRIAREEGIAKLYSGIQPRVMWISIGGAIFFGFYEKSKQVLGLFQHQ